MSETPITAVFAGNGAMEAEVGATTKGWDEVSDEEWLQWNDMSDVASGISANLARYILTEHGIKFEKTRKARSASRALAVLLDAGRAHDRQGVSGGTF